MSSSSFSGTTASGTNFSVSVANQPIMTDIKTFLCPKCNNSYDLHLRSNTYVGRVPLILNCKHTMCEECIKVTFNKREVVCPECLQPSSIVDHEKRKIQEVFPVNFYLMGIIYYSKPNMNEISKLTLRPAGVNYKHRDRRPGGSNTSLCSEPGDVWSKMTTQTIIDEKCSQGGCNKPAMLRCADCVEVYCQFCCETLHKAARGLQTHKITTMSGDFALELTEKCLIHKDYILEFQCNTCDKMECAYCIIKRHHNHSIQQLTFVSDSDRAHFETIVKSADEKLKRLIFAHKKIKLELEQTKCSNQATSLEISVAKYFANFHGRLQILEKKLREDAKMAKNSNFFKLNELSDELLSNIRALYRLISIAKGLDSGHSNNVKFNVAAIIERLEGALDLPSFLVGQQQSLENMGFVCNDILNNLEEYFAINVETTNDGYQLVTEDNLPESYDTALPSELSSIDISECCTPATLEKSLLSGSGTLKSPSELSAKDMLTNALQPKPLERLPATNVEDWVQNVAEETKVPKLKNEDRTYVNVTHIDNPDCFYVQIVDFKNKLDNLSREINQYVRNFAPVLKSVELNKLYIVMYETKNSRPEWHRGRVIDIIINKNEEKVYNVLFIDYGNTQIVNINMLRKINSTLAKPKPFALQCKLYNVYPVKREWDSNAVKLMAQILTGIDVLMIVMNNSEGILEVDLVTLNKGHMYSTREALIFVGHAVPCLNTSTPIDYVKMKSEQPMPKFHTRTESFKKEQILEVILCNVIDPYNIYIQIAENLHHIEHLAIAMVKHYSKPGKGQVYGTVKGENIYVPKKGMVVAVRCSSIGSMWYRGLVKNTFKGQGMVEVFLVDYGKKEIISYIDIRRLADNFRTLECQAILVQMAGIAPINEEKNWNENVTEFLMKYVINKDKLRLVVVEAQKPPKVALFECYESMDVCINALLVKEQLAISTEKISENVEWIKDTTDSINQEPSYVSNLMNTIQCSQNTYVEDSDSDQENANKIRKQVRVLLTKSPDIIYVAFDDTEFKDEQRELHNSLQKHYSKCHKESCDWKIGQPCVVYNRPKNQYFRAIILEKIDDLNFKVMLRDVAVELTVSKGNMYILDDQFKKFREGTIRCHLTGVIPAGDSSKWSGLAIEFLQDVFTKYREIFMTKDGPVDTHRKSFPVIMWYSEFKPGEALEPSRYIEHNINKLLIKKGLALRERPKPSIESDLECKSDDTSTTVDVLTTPNLASQNTSNDKVLHDEDRKLIDISNIIITTQNNSQNSKTKETKLDWSKELEQAISCESEWATATSSEEERPVKRNTKRRKSVGGVETNYSHENLKRISASASNSPHYPSDLYIANTVVKQKQVESLEPVCINWNDLIAEDESPNIEEVAPVPAETTIKSEISDWLPPQPFKKNSFYGYSTFVDDQACIYLHEEKLEPVLKAMEENMKPVFDGIPPEPIGSIWVPGQLCTVKYFVNGSWYRGKILSVGKELIKVLMIDYGNEEECKHEDLRFKVMYLDIPAFANKICLHNICPKKGSKWFTSDLDELHRKIVEHKIFVTLKGKVQTGIPTPAVIKLGNENINNFMLKVSTNLVFNTNLKQNASSESESDDVIVEEEDSVTANNSTQQPTPEVQPKPLTIIRQMSLPRAKYCHNPIPETYEGTKINVMVVSMLNYNKFIFEILINQNIIETKEQFVKISKDISELGHKQPMLIDLEIGQACVTQYSEDGVWYRGEVVSFDDDSETVGIWFVDFGNFETVPKNTVRAILPSWLMLPVLQYIGEVDGIELANESYLEAVFDNMAQYCDTNKLAEILSANPLRVQLYNNDNELAYQDLIDQKMLVLKNECTL